MLDEHNIWNTSRYYIFILISGILLIYGVYIYLKRQRKRVTNVSNKAVFITGCDSGFGRALSIQLDAIGCPVFAGCFTDNGAKELNEVTSSRLKTLPLDVRSNKSIQDALRFITDHMPEDAALWGIVNNAGVVIFGIPAEFQSIQEYEDMIRVNYLGPVDVILTFLPLLKKSKGRIVNVSSLAGMVPLPLCVSYAATKSALYAFSESLRREKASWGIKVATIIPGYYHTGATDTEMVQQIIKKQWKKQPENIIQEYDETTMNEMLTVYNTVKSKYGNTKLSQVTNAMEHALFAENPQATYKCGLDCKVMTFLESVPFGFLAYQQSLAFKYGLILYNYILKKKK